MSSVVRRATLNYKLSGFEKKLYFGKEVSEKELAARGLSM